MANYRLGTLAISLSAIATIFSQSSLKSATMAKAGVHSIAYVTAPKNSANALARSIVSEKLAACVNLVPKMTSIFEWEGKIMEDVEVLMIIKTRTSKIPDLIKYVKSNHPYKVCEIISTPIENGNEDYLNWISSVVPEN